LGAGRRYLPVGGEPRRLLLKRPHSRGGCCLRLCLPVRHGGYCGPTDRRPRLGELLIDGALQLDRTDGTGRLRDLTLRARAAAQAPGDTLATGALVLRAG